jgi:hypothetical protein
VRVCVAPFSLTDGSEAVTAKVVSLPPEPTQQSSPTGWRSVGDAAGQVLSSVAYRCAVASRAYPTLRMEAGEGAVIVPLAGSVE